MRPDTSPHRRVRLLLERLEDRTAPAVIPLSLADPTMLAASGNQSSTGEALSRDGRYVAFLSRSTNLVDGQVVLSLSPSDFSNWVPNVFLFDRISGAVTLVSHSVGSPITNANGSTNSVLSISDDGRFVVYESYAGNIVGSGSVSSATNIYLYDRLSGANTLVSHAVGSATILAGGGSPVISGDGRYVTYTGDATSLVPGATGGGLILYDRTTGLNSLVSHVSGSALTGANGGFGEPAISADGRFIAYTSTSTNLVAGITDTNAVPDVFLYDRLSDTNTLVSRSAGSAATANADSQLPMISGDGRYVAFRSYASNLVSGQIDSADTSDVFLYDRTTGGLSLVSHVPTSLTAAGNQPPKVLDPYRYSPVPSYIHNYVYYSVSDDGWVAFQSKASNLVAGTRDRNEADDIFLYEPATARVTLVSRSATKTGFVANRPSDAPAISGDGRYIGFRSSAGDVIAGQTNANSTTDAFLYDRITGRTVLVSHEIGNTAASVTPGGTGYRLTLSRDGSVAAYDSDAPYLAPLAFGQPSNVFVYDRATATNRLASHRAPNMAALTGSGHSQYPAMSADGRFVAFVSAAVNLLPGRVGAANYGTYGARNVFLLDRQTGQRTLVSHAADAATAGGNGHSIHAEISADGRYVAHLSTAGDLVAGETHSTYYTNLYLFDRITGRNTFIAETDSGGAITFETISADGRFVAFVSWESDVFPGLVDSNRGPDVFLYDRDSRAITLVSHAPNSLTTAAGGQLPYISGDGRYVAFMGYAPDVVNVPPPPPNVLPPADVFIYDWLTGANTLVSKSFKGIQVGGYPLGLSADGSSLVFSSGSGNLVPGMRDNNNVSDVFLYDVPTGAMAMVTTAGGTTATPEISESRKPVTSDDGRWVAYLVGVGGKNDVFLYDRVSQTRTLVSHQSGATGVAANDTSFSAYVSGDGRYVTYESRATNLVDGQIDRPGTVDIFQFDRTTGANRLVSHASASAATAEQLQLFMSGFTVCGDGSFVVFSSSASNLVAGDRNNSYDVFGYSTRDAAPPVTVQSVQANDGSPQRSMVTSATVVFSTLVTLPTNPAAAFQLTRTGPGGPTGDVMLAVDLSGSTALQTVARLTFSGPLTQLGSLIDGNYTLTVFGSQVTGPSAALLDGDADGTPGGDNVSALFRLFGDVNGDRAVNGLDLAVFRTAFGQFGNYLSYLDYNSDGITNGLDLAVFRGRFGMILP